MIELYTKVVVDCINAALPGAIIFALTNKAIDIILTAAFGGKLRL